MEYSNVKYLWCCCSVLSHVWLFVTPWTCQASLSITNIHLLLLLLLSRSVVSDSVQPHRLQPTRLPHPWDSPGKNTGMGCHVLLQCIKVKSESEVTQSYLTPSDPMDCSLPGSSVHGIFQARVLEQGCHRLLRYYHDESQNLLFLILCQRYRGD